MKKIAIFASGNGTNARCITRYFYRHSDRDVSLIVASRADAPVLEKARSMHIPNAVLTADDMTDSTKVLMLLRKHGVNIIVLAGYMLRIPEYLIKAFPKAIVNIHPSLLPKYGGKGMYGMRVHQAVIDNKEKESGITIHYVDEQYDTGHPILQVHCPVLSTDTAETLAQRIHTLEYKFYPMVIEKL